VRSRRRTSAVVAAALTTLAALLGAPSTAVAQSGPLIPPVDTATTSVPDGWPTPPGVPAAAYIVIDAVSGQVIAARAPDERRPVASTIKILTALSVLVREPYDSTVEVGDEVVGLDPDGALLGLKPGDVWSMEDALEGLIVRSGNDMARALAVEVAGSVGGFLELMRADAASVGLAGVTIEEPDGIDDLNLLSARDLAVLGRAAMSNAVFADIARQPQVDLPELGTVESRNDLLLTYPGADGVKTGFTDLAGRCLVASATRGDRRLIAVVLGTTDAFDDATALLDFGFDSFRSDLVTDAETIGTRIRVPGGWVVVIPEHPLTVLVPVDDPVNIDLDLPIELTSDRRELTFDARWQGQSLASLPAELPGVAASDEAGGAAVGAWVWDRAYAAMRAATEAGAWPS